MPEDPWNPCYWFPTIECYIEFLKREKIMLSIFLLSTLPIIVLDVSEVPTVEPDRAPLSEPMILVNKEGDSEQFRGIPPTHGVLFIGREHKCFEEKEQIGFAFNPASNSTTAAEALTKLAVEGSSVLDSSTSPLYPYLQIWVDLDGSGTCSSNEVYSAQDMHLSFDLESVSDSDFRYGDRWSINAEISFTFKFYNEFGELTESTPKVAYSSLLRSE
ncbi:hypothetical protein [Aliidiomarina indica]|uniref:hypothetical protein n=1 Tax=Aliidiomarina indica TaxID=2749147 RepID=UPI00188F1A64|nr:hypothetical protein [Aliidiomarina indica]